MRFAPAGQAPPPCTPAAHCARAGRGVTAFWLKYQDRDRVLRRVTLTEPYRRAVGGNLSDMTVDISYY